MSRYENQCGVVTGDTSGIGAATVRAIESEGGKMVVADLQEEPSAALVAELREAACSGARM